MKMIPVKNVKAFISKLKGMLHTLHLPDEAWHKFNTIADLYLGNNIRDTIKDDSIDEITIIWHIEDVQSVRLDLTDKQARHVLQNLKENHDADVGINWESIEITAENLFPENITAN